MDKIVLGKLGEDFAAANLVSKGYHILKRNFRAKRYGEVDIIAISPDQKSLVFIEVKTRIGDRFGRPEEAITRRKQNELKKMVSYYYSQFPQPSLTPRIDVIAIKFDSTTDSLPSIEHLENITL